MTFKWSVGVTTVPERRDTTLPRTLASLKMGGFGKLRLFVDKWSNKYDLLSLSGNAEDASCRYPRIGAWGNWLLSLTEMHLRDPEADRYVIFQDDVVCVKDLREYLERSTRILPTQATKHRQYWNLYTADKNDQVIAATTSSVWSEAAVITGGGTKQIGKGALGLMFTLEGVETLLSSRIVVTKPRSTRPRTRIDGTIVNAMNAAGWREMIHNPSLLDHIGHESVIAATGDDRGPHGPFPKCQSFPGENKSALDWSNRV